MNENDIIAEFVKEKYPELSETFDFGMFRMRKAVEEMRDIFLKNIKEIDFSVIAKEIVKINNSLPEDR